MAKGGFLSLLANVAVAVAAVVLLYIVVKALWAEIGPMVRLVFHRDRVTVLKDDEAAR
jgi:hypothetical protein